MKFHIRNFLVCGILALSSLSCSRDQSGVDSNEAIFDTSQFPAAIAIPTPEPYRGAAKSFPLKGMLVFQRDEKLESIATGKKTSAILRDNFSADEWHLSRDGRQICFAQEPNDVEFFDVVAHRNYVFTASFNSASRVLLAAYGPRAQEATYDYGPPTFDTDKIVVDEETPQQFMDDPSFSWIAIYDVKTRKRVWRSDDFIQSLPLKNSIKSRLQREVLCGGVVSPDGNDMVCLTCEPSGEPGSRDKAPLTLLVHLDLKNHRAEIIDSFVNLPILCFYPSGGKIGWNEYEREITTQFSWHPTKKEFLWIKPICSAKSLLAKGKSANTELFRFDLKTKKGHRLTNNSQNDFSPQWSLDGKSIIWLRDGHIFRAHADGSNQTAILPQLGGVTQIQLLPKIPDWSRYRKLSIEPLAGQDK